MQELDRLLATRIVSTPSALDGVVRAVHELPLQAVVMRTAPDEMLIFPPQPDLTVADEHAIVIEDTGWAGGWFSAEEALDFLSRQAEWEIPSERPAFAQGSVAGVATKMYFEEDRVFFVVPAPYSAEMADRMNH